MAGNSKTRKANALEGLRRAILTQALAPGADLDEARLAEEFALSRTPLREVLRELAGDGYVDLRENKGARVSEMSHQTLRDFFQAAPMIYAAVLRLAAQNATADQISLLKKSQQNFKAALQGRDAVARAIANNEFHEITGDMAGNVFLRPSFRRLLIDHARISMTFYRPDDVENEADQIKASSQHDAIIAAIESHDEDAAAQLADDHWSLSRGRIAQFVMPAAVTAPLGTFAPLTEV